MLPAALISLAPSLVDLVRRFIPDKDKQREAESAIINTLTEAGNKLGDAMIADAQSGDKFQSRWRPAVGWICVAGVGLDFLVFPVLNMIRGFMAQPAIASQLDAASLMGLLMALLGMGTLRTVEKFRGRM